MRNLPPDLINHYTLFKIYKDARTQIDQGRKEVYIVPKPIRKNYNIHLFG